MENPRSKKVPPKPLKRVPPKKALFPGSRHPLLKRISYLSPLQPIKPKKCERCKGKGRIRLGKRCPACKGEKTEWGQAWQRPAEGAKESLRYFWYIHFKIQNERGKLVKDAVMNIGLFKPSELKDPEVVKSTIAESFRKMISRKSTSPQRPSAKYHPGKKHTFTITQRFRHKTGYAKRGRRK